MRFDAVFDSFYVLSSLWGGLSGSSVCSVRPPVLPRIASEAVRTPRLGDAAAVTAFVNVNVLPMDTERVLANHTVVVQGGRITALGPSAGVTVPAGAVRVDGRGKYLMPGLTDMHFHLWGIVTGQNGRGFVRAVQDSLFRDLAGGVTSVRFVGGWHQDRQWYRDSLRPEVPTPHIYWPSRISANPAIRPDSVAAWVAAAKTAGYDFIMMPYYYGPGNIVQKTVTRGPVGDELIVVDSFFAAARRMGLPVAMHDTPYPFDRVLASGAARGSYEHVLVGPRDVLLPGWEDVWKQASIPEPSLAMMQQAAAALHRAGVWVTPTLQCTARDGSAAASHPTVAKFYQLTKALQEAGVKLLLSGDDGWTVHDELTALVRAGLTPYQALRTGTWNPAEYFGQLDSLGTVAVGKRADLVLLSGNPLTDIRHTRTPAGVMRAGRWLDRAELDRRLLAWRSSGLHTQDPARPVPQPWLLATLYSPGLFARHANKPSEYPAVLQPLAALVDSLAAVPSANRSAYEPLMRRVAAELGALRGPLSPLSQERFDAIAGVWLREHRRQGYQVAIPGVTMP